MKTKTIGMGLIVLLSLMMALPIVGVQADPIDDWDEAVVIIGMKLRHKELRDLNPADWYIVLGDMYKSGWRWLRDVTVTDTSDQYDLNWTGAVVWHIYTQEWEFYYEDYWDFNVTAFGDGTTDPGPGMHYVKPGDSYTFTAKPHASGDVDWKYVLDYWDVSNTTDAWQVKGRVLIGTADSDLNITAVFRRKSTHTCNVWYEDGLTAWTLWQKRHVPLTVWLPFGEKYVTLSIESDYGSYDKTFYVSAKNMCVYFSAERFVGDYTVTVTAVDVITDETYSPEYFVAIT